MDKKLSYFCSKKLNFSSDSDCLYLGPCENSLTFHRVYLYYEFACLINSMLCKFVYTYYNSCVLCFCITYYGLFMHICMVYTYTTDKYLNTYLIYTNYYILFQLNAATISLLPNILCYYLYKHTKSYKKSLVNYTESIQLLNFSILLELIELLYRIRGPEYTICLQC